MGDILGAFLVVSPVIFAKCMGGSAVVQDITLNWPGCVPAEIFHARVLNFLCPID